MPNAAVGLGRIGIRLVLLAGIWWVLTEGDRGSWVVGIPVVTAAALASWAVAPGGRGMWRFSGLVRFVPFFLWHSLNGGLDVGWRALHPRMPLEPRFYDYSLRLPSGAGRILFVDSLSLLPGTLSATLHDEQDYVTVHLLMGGRSTVEKLQQLETAIGRLYGLQLPAAEVPRDMESA